MNLHAIVFPYISVVNPMVYVEVRSSTGPSATAADGDRTPTFATPGAITGSITGTTLTVATITAGVLQPGQLLADTTTALLLGTRITAQLTGARGGVGTYSVNQEQTVALEAMTTSLFLLAQVQPLSIPDLKQIEGLNIQGDKKSIYINGALDAVIRVTIKGGDLVVLPDGSVYLISQVLEGFNLTAGWTKAVGVLQDGS